MKFTKMHGIGNDYIYVNCFEETVKDPAATSVYVSDRHFGIGSDGLILIKPCDEADFRMEIYNADGSRAKMCGNGIRCVGKYLYDHGYTRKHVLVIETRAGLRQLTLREAAGKIVSASVEMGTAKTTPGSAGDLVDKNLENFLPLKNLQSQGGAR